MKRISQDETLLTKRIDALASLGQFLSGFSFKEEDPFTQVLKKGTAANGWFTRDFLNHAIQTWGDTLTHTNLEKWVSKYQLKEPKTPKTVALILAGNIPLVGLHDLLCVWVSGHHALVKCASKDPYLLPFIADFLEQSVNEAYSRIQFTDEKLEGYDAVIATGSNNSARYFEYYFSKVPHIIRKNRNGIAVLSGNESKEELKALATDLVMYYGLGCRNVSKLFLPEGYDLNQVFEGLYRFSEIIQNSKYANNYDYNRAILLMNNRPFWENGFFILKEDKAYAAPIALAHFEYYIHLEAVKKQIAADSEKIQCVVSHMEIPQTIPFGSTQKPQLWEYADGLDTLAFLTNL